jgi:hypothetical protein
MLATLDVNLGRLMAGVLDFDLGSDVWILPKTSHRLYGV